MRIAVFSGTGDGRELCEYLRDIGHSVAVYVATGYGASFIPDAEVYAGRLSAARMAEAVAGCGAVIDATHPYAAEATKNIRAACEQTGVKYYRLIRNETPRDGCVSVPDIKSAVEYLTNTSGKIFVSTGSKELAEFEPVGERVRARVLDTPEVRGRCRGMAIAEIIYKTPPYSSEDNSADFNGCRYLVTKDGGRVGGTDEKLDAARRLGMIVIMIERPKTERGGCSLAELKALFR